METIKNQPAPAGRGLTGCLLVVFLVVATIALILGVVFLATALRGVETVAGPVGDLMRGLSREATPVVVPSPAIVIEEISSLARLETASYSFQDVIEIQHNRELLFGAFGETLLFVAFGEVIAGVDLAKIEPGDVQVVDVDTVIVHLPETEVLVSRLDNERSYVANRDLGLFTRGNPDLETQVRREAEARMVAAALEGGILERADVEAQRFMQTFLAEFGFTEVIFVDTPPPPITPVVPTIPKGFVTPPATTP